MLDVPAGRNHHPITSHREINAGLNGRALVRTDNPIGLQRASQGYSDRGVASGQQANNRQADQTEA
jgi:hypothetical protein